MADKKRIVQPTEGSQDLGRETNREVVGRPSAGSNTQLLITAKGGSKKKKKNSQEGKAKPTGKAFLRADETDE